MKKSGIPTLNLMLVILFTVFANFAKSEELKPFTANGDCISLEGKWLFQLDNKEKDGIGLKQGWFKPDFDDSQWKTIKVGETWESQGYNYNGVAWYRQKVFIPESWKNDTLMFNLGRPDDRGEVYFNGEKVKEVKKFGPHFIFQIPKEKIKFGAENSLAVRIVDWYMNGGMNYGNYSIRRLVPLGTGKSTAKITPPMKLSLNDNLKDGLLEKGHWEAGWRDAGTSDTRPKMSVERGAYQGKDAVVMDIWYPNSSEYVDYFLKPGEKGTDWQKNGYNYLSFWYKSDMGGEIKVRLNKGKVLWKKGKAGYTARVFIEPGEWKKVILPFSAFTLSTRNGSEELSDPSYADAVSLGYGNHELQKAGKIRFADFQVGAFDINPEGQPISLAGLWRFKLDNHRPDGTKSIFKKDTEESKKDSQGYGLELGWNKPEFDDKSWDIISIPGTWESQGYSYDGPAWYRQTVFIPKDWEGKPLHLQLGQPDDRGELYWNGKEIQKIEKFGPNFEVMLKPEQVKYGEFNSLAMCIYDWYINGGINGDKLSISPKTDSMMVQESGKPDTLASLDNFEMGAKPGKPLELVFTFYGKLTKGDGQTLDFRVIDCFHRTVASGNIPVKRSANGDLIAVAKLTTEEAEQFYYGEWIDANALMKNKDSAPIKAFTWHQQKLKYAKRDNLELPTLPETYEETPIGKLKLVDVIECGENAAQDPHPYKQGGVRAFWGGRRAYATWEHGIKVREFQGRKYREANNEEHFGYRIGRGKMKPYKQYLLRILYPEDKSRYFAMDIKAGRNYQGVGFRTGVDPELCKNEPETPYPISGKYEWCDNIVSLDDLTYGYNGKRSVDSKYGFWVFFHDIGRVYSPQYDSGPAVAEIRLYEIDDPEKHYPEIRYPEGKKRVIMMDWERQPEANPVDVAQYARLLGVNALGPVFLKWSFNGYFHNSQEYNGAPEWFGFPVHRDGFGNENCWKILELWLDATKKNDVTLIPRLEYGGSPKLPKEARVIAANGKQDPCGRYTPWGANLLHPATWEDVKVLLDEVVGKNIKKYPNMGGILWRMRSDRMKCSYGKQDVELFCKETGKEMPKGNTAEIAKWASKTMGKEYHEWWHKKRRDFHVKIRDYLRSIRPDLKLYYYNWDPDGWSLATDNNAGNSAKDWSELYNVDKSREWYKRKVEVQKKLTDIDYVKRLQGNHRMTGSEPHKHLKAELYRDFDGIALFLPVHWDYLSDNEPYIRSFMTGDGLAVCNQFKYEEKGRTNVQGDNYETSEMTPGGPSFSMAEEVLSVFHGDPNVITWTPYTIGRSFITEHRRFAQAFLALPDMRGKIIENAVTPADKEIRVRSYKTDKGTYIGVVSKKYTPADFNVTLSGDWKAGTTITDLVTGKIVPSEIADGKISFKVSSGAMQLNSYLIK